MSLTSTSTDRWRFELQALRLGLYGLDGIDRRVIRSLSRGPLWLETRLLLQSYGIAESDIAELTGVHRSGCPCWACVLRLNQRARVHRDKLKAKAAGPKVGG